MHKTSSFARGFSRSFLILGLAACQPASEEHHSDSDQTVVSGSVAVSSAAGGALSLKWVAKHGTAGYVVSRAPLVPEGYLFSKIAELPPSATSFTDSNAGPASVVYQIEAIGETSSVYPVLARVVIPHFVRLAPIAVDLQPSNVATALASLRRYGLVRNASTGEVLTRESSVHAGMVLDVEDADGSALVMTGAAPTTSEVVLAARKSNVVAVPLRDRPLVVDGLGIDGVITTSVVFTDGNNRPAEQGRAWVPGAILSFGLDRATRLDLAAGSIEQEAPIPVVAEPPPAFAGTPDDATEVVVLYDASYKTKHYKCWTGGKSGAWDGITDGVAGAEDVKNAGVVRRGGVVYVQDQAGTTSSSKVTVWAPSRPGQDRKPVAWKTSFDSAKSAAAITIPADAPIGDYHIQMGDTRGNYATVYVIFDPTPLKDKYGLSNDEWRSWTYDDSDWQSVADTSDYLNYVYEGPGYPVGSSFGTNVYGYRGDSTAESGADGGVFGQRWVEMAMSIHGDDTDTPLEAAMHGYEVIGQRIAWLSGKGWYGKGDNSGAGQVNTFDQFLKGSILGPEGTVHHPKEYDVVTAEKAALGLGWTDRLPPEYIVDLGNCFDYATHQAALYRAMGIPSRAAHTIGGAGWISSFHVWAEVCLDNPEIHPKQDGWWKGCWYKADSNDPSTGGSTSHEEGNFTPTVISGWGDYLINEYKQCEGIGYGGTFYNNYFGCKQTMDNPGTHTAVGLKPNTTAPAEVSGTFPLNVDYTSSSSAWALVNLFVPWNGPAKPSGKAYILDHHHGYALNDKMFMTSGVGFIDDSSKENDVPELPDGAAQRGLLGGWGYMMYRIPVNGRKNIIVKLEEGADKVEILATKDRNLFSTNKRWDLDFDFRSDASGTLEANTDGAQQLYLWMQLKGFTLSKPGTPTTLCCGYSGMVNKGQHLVWYTIRAGTGNDGGIVDGGNGGAGGASIDGGGLDVAAPDGGASGGRGGAAGSNGPGSDSGSSGRSGASGSSGQGGDSGSSGRSGASGSSGQGGSDSGGGGSGAAGGPRGGSGGGGGASNGSGGNGTDSTDDLGCACVMSSRSGGTPGALSSLILLSALRIRRRTRCRSFAVGA